MATNASKINKIIVMSILPNPNIQRYQFLPPLSNDEDFENFITDYFNSLDKSYSYDRFGRKGQQQYGLDVYSVEKKTVIQCKCKILDSRSDKAIVNNLLKELENDFSSFLVYNKAQADKFCRFIFASTFKNDTHLATRCNELSNDQITVEYWSWDKIVKNITREVFDKYYPSLIDCTEAYYAENSSNVYKPISINKDNPLLDQLHSFVLEAYKELNYLPLHLFSNQYPFKVKEDFYAYHSIFTLYTDNEELIVFFQSIKVQPDGQILFKNLNFIKDVENWEAKTIKVLSALNWNSIFSISSHTNDIYANIFYRSKERCDCIRCKFSRFELKEAFDSINDTPNGLDEKLKLAYFNYEVGNFIQSSKMFRELLFECSEKPLLQYIIKFNLSHLLILIKNHYWEEFEQYELVDELKSIDLNGEFNKLVSGRTNKYTLEYIHHERFFYNSFLSIQRSVKTIKSHYFSQLKGGRSYNNEVQNLISTFVQLISFIDRNHIIYDAFREFNELVDTFIEGILASHAIDSKHKSRLEKIDDFLLNNILYYGNADNILKYFYRYNLKELKYEKTADNNQAFVDIIIKFLSTSQEAWQSFNRNCEKANHYFSERYTNFFRNFLLLASLSRLTPKQVNEIVIKLIVFLTTETTVPQYNYNYLQIFIARKGSLISKRNLTGLIRVCLSNGKAHRGRNRIFETIAQQMKESHVKFHLSDLDFQNLYTIAFKRCAVCDKEHDPLFIIPFYNVLSSPDQKKRIHEGIKEYLKNKFDMSLYYEAAIYNILGYIPEFMGKFLDHVKPKDQPISLISVPHDDKRFPSLNMFIDLCFKYEIDLTNSKYHLLRGINDYYDWLLDMKNFDYTKFNPKWVSEYKSAFYISNIQKFPIIKAQMFSFLQSNINNTLERDFVLFFGNAD